MCPEGAQAAPSALSPKGSAPVPIGVLPFSPGLMLMIRASTRLGVQAPGRFAWLTSCPAKPRRPPRRTLRQRRRVPCFASALWFALRTRGGRGSDLDTGRKAERRRGAPDRRSAFRCRMPGPKGEGPPIYRYIRLNVGSGRPNRLVSWSTKLELLIERNHREIYR